MKSLITAVCCTLFTMAAAHAADPQGEAKKGAPAAEKKAANATDKAAKEPTEAQKKQQARMKDCSTRAEGKSGEERKQFMSSCLKG